MVEPLAIAFASTTPSLSRMALRFYAAMFLYQDIAPFTAKALCGIVEASTASGSTALRELEAGGMIFRTRPIGSRSDVYDLVDETQYGQLYAERYLRQLPTMRQALQVLPVNSKASLRISSAIDLFQCLAEEVPQIFMNWQKEKAARYGR